ncbi:MAG: hypothetical protein ACRDPH_16870 [Marmoricola sp.]
MDAIVTGSPDAHSPRWGHVVVRRCDSHGGCYGDFTSNDGSIHRDDVRIWNGDRLPLGRRVRAYADAADHDVTRPGSQAVLWDVVGLLVLGSVFAVAAYGLVRHVLLRRAVAHPSSGRVT